MDEGGWGGIIAGMVTSLGIGGVVGTWARSKWPARESLQAWTLDVLDRKERRDDALIERLSQEIKDTEAKVDALVRQLELANETIAALREELAILRTTMEITQDERPSG